MELINTRIPKIPRKTSKHIQPPQPRPSTPRRLRDDALSEEENEDEVVGAGDAEGIESVVEEGAGGHGSGKDVWETA